MTRIAARCTGRRPAVDLVRCPSFTYTVMPSARSSSSATDSVSLPDAAYMLGITYSNALDLLYTRRIEGKRGLNGRWQISRASLLRERHRRLSQGYLVPELEPTA